ncbi:MAG: class I tRNA ligase family protein, partial [Oscillospiraceae bacterium]|nr:class I tRNA ligase family protein [Oscillospiraceae bacterium]
ELDYWYPTSVMVTGYDIIFFWVARMIFSGMEQMKKQPFDKVLIHGIVRDSLGRKMSKSLGNGIDPLVIAEKYGADALRFNLITGNSPGNDMRFYEEKCEAMRNFCNKIWNASRFVMMNLKVEDNTLPAHLEPADKWILSKLNRLAKEVTENLDSYELGVAAQKIYDFIWDSFCDWYIELSKARLSAGDEDVQRVLLYVLTDILKLLHPFMPFITEEIYQAIPHTREALIIETFPEYKAELEFPGAETEFEKVIDAITAIRSRRAEMNVAPSRKAKVIISTPYPEIFEASAAYFTRLAGASEVEVRGGEMGADDEPQAKGMVSAITHYCRIAMPLAELVDLKAERERVTRELGKTRGLLEGQERKLSNEGFVSRAPANVVAAEREKAEKLRALIENLEKTLSSLE